MKETLSLNQRNFRKKEKNCFKASMRWKTLSKQIQKSLISSTKNNLPLPLVNIILALIHIKAFPIITYIFLESFSSVRKQKRYNLLSSQSKYIAGGRFDSSVNVGALCEFF